MPYIYTDAELELFAEIFTATIKNIKKSIQLESFYFVNIYDFRQKEQVLDKIRSRGILVLDYSNIDLRSLSPRLKIPHDNHPTSEYYWLLTQFLKRDIFQN